MQTCTLCVQADKSQMQQLPDNSISFLITMPLLLLFPFLKRLTQTFQPFFCKRVNSPEAFLLLALEESRGIGCALG